MGEKAVAGGHRHLSNRELAEIGFVFQRFNLFPHLRLQRRDKFWIVAHERLASRL
jgi:ABC-type polar amino acid transport system ATPase subunit